MTVPSSNREWIYWGRNDPLYAVATLPDRQIGGTAQWDLKDFMEFGRIYFAEVIRQWKQYGVGHRRCVEIGCGSGRMTRWLAEQFDHVVALDVSEAQLQTAAKVLGDHGKNVTLTLVAEPAIPLPDASCDAVFTCEVLQHLDSIRPIVAYMREAFRILEVGGSICFQLPVVGLQSVTITSSEWRNRLLGLLRVLGRRRMMIYRRYSAPQIISLLRDAGFQEIEMRFFQAKPQQGSHAYFFARKR
jgi:ubiquinone/menaquinone biosynthesis C-methylase UbiE